MMRLYRIFTIRQVTVFTAVLLAVAALVFASRGGSVSAAGSAQERKLPVYCVGRGEDEKKVISLTFDAAWGNEDTPLLIEILGRYDIRATFFCVASWVEKYPESVKQLSEAGHEIMNHSTTHPHMSQLTEQQIREEVQTCNDRIEAITGRRPTLFRAPYGEYDDKLIGTLDGMGMHCIQWDVDSLDWKEPPASEIASRVCSRVKNGSIVLFHNAALNTPEALPQIIETLIAEGYTFAPVSENIYYEDYTIDYEGCQRLNGK